MRIKFILLVLHAIAMGNSKIIKGVDVSTPLTVKTLKCLMGKGYDFVIPRAYRSFGAVDNNALQTLKNA